MKYRILIGCIAILCACSSPANEANNKLHTQDPAVYKSGLKITYKPTRGQSYMDSQGIKHHLRHIPTIIKNDSTITIRVKITFSTEYDYPKVYNDESFRIFPMPKIWALDGVNISDSTLNELPKYIHKPSMENTLDPGEEWLLAFGTLYPSKINYGVFPVAFFSHDNRELYHECNRLIDPQDLSIPPLALTLLLGFTSGSQASPDSCISLSAGQISYPGI